MDDPAEFKGPQAFPPGHSGPDAARLAGANDIELVREHAAEEDAGHGTGAWKGLRARDVKVKRLLTKLQTAARRDPERTFPHLYQHVYREDILAIAYRLSRKNKGAAGVDGRTFEDIQRYGVKKCLQELRNALKGGKYKPQPVKRVHIEKPEGGKRPLGIPVVEDRVVQTAVLLIVGSILEADLSDNAHGFRADRNQKTALKAIEHFLKRDEIYVVDADIKSFFDTIPHAKLMSLVSRRIADKRILRLIRMWLKASVKERNEMDHEMLTSGKRRKNGTPQGGVISPLLANLYLNELIKMWNQQVFIGEMKGTLIAYADDFVILCPDWQDAVKAYKWAARKLPEMGLTLSRKKTRIRDTSKKTFNFLGFTLGPVAGEEVPIRPADKAVYTAKERFTKKVTKLARSAADPKTLTKKVNEILRGWKNYFSYGNFSMAFRAMDEHVLDILKERLRKYPDLKEKLEGDLNAAIYGDLGVIRLSDLCNGKTTGDDAAAAVLESWQGGGDVAPGRPGRVPLPYPASSPADAPGHANNNEDRS